MLCGENPPSIHGLTHNTWPYLQYQPYSWLRVKLAQGNGGRIPMLDKEEFGREGVIFLCSTEDTLDAFHLIGCPRS